jgi:hypothetical protein
LLAAVAAGCSSGVASVSIQSPGPASTSPASGATAASSPGGRSSSPSPSASPAPSPSAAAAAQPLPASTRRNLPAGVFYVLAGKGLASLNLWQVTQGGRERQLTHNRRGFGIDAFDASSAGIILADGSSNGDDLARLTPRGPLLLRQTSGRLALLRGSSPDIRNDGTIGYVSPPVRPGSRTGSDFEIWTQRSFTGRGTILLRQRHPLAGPVFGPHGQIAVEGWAGRPGGRRPSVLIFRDGDVRRLLTGVAAIPSLMAWGQQAPALALAFPDHAAELLFPDGRRQRLPAGWQPLAWSPDGTELLMQSATALGVWSMSVPGQITRIGPITRGLQILQADWLAKKAPL